MKEPLDYDMLILDEIIGAVSLGVIEEDTLIDFLKSKPLHMEILLSGRNASNKIIEIADYVSEIKCIKHPFEHSIVARKGIEY